jgi:hypothetical protein
MINVLLRWPEVSPDFRYLLEEPFLLLEEPFLLFIVQYSLNSARLINI